MDEKMKIGFQSLVKLLISAAIAFGAWYAGFSVYFGDMRMWIIVASVSGAVVISAIIANLICFAVFKRLPDKIKAKTAQDFAENIMRKVQANYAKARRNVNFVLAFSYIYVLLMIALAATAEFALAHIIVDEALSAFAAMLITIFVLYPLVDVFFGRPESPVPHAGRELAQGAFPMLYDTARAAAKKLDCDMPVRLLCLGRTYPLRCTAARLL